MFTFSLSDDFLGYGKIFSSLTQGTEDCGSRPICLGWTKNCKEKIKNYDECVTRVAELKYSSAAQRKDSEKKINIAPYVILAGIGIIIFIIINKYIKTK